MGFDRPLRGSCACHRNKYFIRAPEGADEVAQVLFSTVSEHRVAQASPLSAYIRIPLTWYYSATFAFFPDETASQIRRVFENSLEAHSRRTHCGFCGTPLTYWSEQPRAEADYIQVTMGSLCCEDLCDLEDMGLIPEPPAEGHTVQLPSIVGRGSVAPVDGASKAPAAAAATSPSTALQLRDQRETTSIPWFDSIVEGSSLGGRLKATQGTRQRANGSTRIEWEIFEYTGDGSEERSSPFTGNYGKRKLGDRNDGDDDRIVGVSPS